MTSTPAAPVPPTHVPPPTTPPNPVKPEPHPQPQETEKGHVQGPETGKSEHEHPVD